MVPIGFYPVLVDCGTDFSQTVLAFYLEIDLSPGDKRNVSIFPPNSTTSILANNAGKANVSRNGGLQIVISQVKDYPTVQFAIEKMAGNEYVVVRTRRETWPESLVFPDGAKIVLTPGLSNAFDWLIMEANKGKA